MKMSRTSRYVAALITLFSLLFTQLAVASYVCPDLAPRPVSVASVNHGGMAGCTGMDAKQAGLCKAHCDNSHQSLDAPAAPHVAPFVAAALTCVLPDVTLAEANLGVADTAMLLRQATAPPIAIRNCCFRI
jgi:hypothetical protein